METPSMKIKRINKIKKKIRILMKSKGDNNRIKKINNKRNKLQTNNSDSEMRI